MQFELTEEHRMFQKLGKDFADREIEPVAEAIEREGQMPADMLKKLADVGLLGISAPDRYGGLETGFLTYLLAVEQMHYPCAPCSWLLAGNEFSDVVGRMGTDTQKEEFLPGIVQGRGLPGFAFGEDGVEGSTAEADVTANPQGDGWLINGARRFQVFGSAEGPVIFLAKTGAGQITSFLVPKHLPGYAASRPIQLLGLRGLEVVDTFYENLKVSADNILGEKGGGLQVAGMLAACRGLRLSMQSVACAQRALDEAVKYSKERTRRGVPIAAMQAIQWLLAEMAMRVEPARWATYEAAWLKDQGRDVHARSAISQLFAGHVAREVAGMAIQVHGCYGLTKDYRIERIYRQAKMFELIEGSREAQVAVTVDALLAN